MEVIITNEQRSIAVEAMLEDMLKTVLAKMAEVYGLDEAAEVGVTLSDDAGIPDSDKQFIRG